MLYPNHPPTTVLWLAGLTSIFGDHEWVYRFGTLVFSVLNILLIFRIGRFVWPIGDGAYWASLFQSLFLGTIYFGTHVDVLSEMTVSFILLSALASLRSRWVSSGIYAILAGLHSWCGYLMFAPLLVLASRRKQGVKRVFALGTLGFVIGIGMILYLLSSGDILKFLEDRLINARYVERSDRSFSSSALLILKYMKVFVSSHARMLSPLFAGWAFYELLKGPARNLLRLKLENRYEEALLLTGAVGFITSIIGYQYVMVHIFWFILWMPFFALLCAQFVLSFQETPNLKTKAIVPLTLLFAALYPYGIYQTNRLHDVFNSAVLAGTALYFLYRYRKIQSRQLLGLVLVVGFANFSQMINYRNEPSTDYEFCRRAREEFHRTQLPVRSEGDWNMARTLYCIGIEFQK